MIRVFHPIGQGVFYSERHGGFNMVYDCGEWKNSKRSTQLVKNSFKSGSQIDLLFISHFDYDHISKIDILRDNYVIKVCILPCLYDEQKIALSNIYRGLGYLNIVELIENPKDFFEHSKIANHQTETKVVFVRPIGEVKRETNQELSFEDLVSNKGDQYGEIDSGCRIKINNWVYIPCNTECAKHHDELIESFKTNNLDYEKIIKYIDYCLKNSKKIKQVYNQLEGRINANSMFVYSGPQDSSSCHIKRLYFGLSSIDCNICLLFKEIFEKEAGCIFAGDTDLKDLIPFYHQFRDRIGTIQLPHHGSAKSFDYDFLEQKNECLFFPASYGTKNTYGHPAQSVICNIVENGSFFIPVSENQETMFIQVI